MAWNPNRCNPSITIDPDGVTVRKTDNFDRYTKVAGFPPSSLISADTSYFEIKLTATTQGHVGVGVGLDNESLWEPALGSLPTSAAYWMNGWFSNGSAPGLGALRGTFVAFSQGESIGVSYTKSTQEVAWWRGEQKVASLIAIWDGTEPVSPYLQIHDSGDVITATFDAMPPLALTGAVSWIADLEIPSDPNSAKIHAVDIVDSTLPGRVLLTAVDEASQRTALGLGSAALQPTAVFAPTIHAHATSDITGFSEAIDDRVAALLQQGSGIALSYNDLANALTIAATGGGGGGGPITSLNITDSTAVGRALLTAVDATAQRTALGLGSAATQATAAFAPSTHAHPISDVTGLQTALNAKAALSHTHPISDVTGLQPALDSKSFLTRTQNFQTGTAYTFALTDAGNIVSTNNASPNTVTVPTNATAAFPVGAQIDLLQLGVGQTSVAPAAGVTIRSDAGKLKLSNQYAPATLLKLAINEWILFGSLSP